MRSVHLDAKHMVDAVREAYISMDLLSYQANELNCSSSAEISGIIRSRLRDDCVPNWAILVFVLAFQALLLVLDGIHALSLVNIRYGLARPRELYLDDATAQKAYDMKFKQEMKIERVLKAKRRKVAESQITDVAELSNKRRWKSRAVVPDIRSELFAVDPRRIESSKSKDMEMWLSDGAMQGAFIIGGKIREETYDTMEGYDEPIAIRAPPSPVQARPAENYVTGQQDKSDRFELYDESELDTPKQNVAQSDMIPEGGDSPAAEVPDDEIINKKN